MYQCVYLMVLKKKKSFIFVKIIHFCWDTCRNNQFLLYCYRCIYCGNMQTQHQQQFPISLTHVACIVFFPSSRSRTYDLVESSDNDINTTWLSPQGSCHSAKSMTKTISFPQFSWFLTRRHWAPRCSWVLRPPRGTSFIYSQSVSSPPGKSVSSLAYICSAALN